MIRRNTIMTLLLAVLLVLLASGCGPPAGLQNAEPGPTPPPPAQQSPSEPNQAPQTQANPGRYFPLTVGSTWEYHGLGNEYAGFTRQVLYAEDNRAQVKESNGGTVSTAIYEVTGDAVTRIFSRGEDYQNDNQLDQPANDNTVILKAPLQVGNKWQTQGGDREIVSMNALVSSPAGQFKDCIKVKVAGRDSTIYEYYHQGVGMIRREFVSQDAEVSSTLKSYTIK